MFTGIVAGMGRIEYLGSEEVIRMVLDFGIVSTSGLVTGASVSVEGVCLTVVEINGSLVSFDLIPETLISTTLGEKSVGNWVNLERALKFGDEIGGHLLSGHIMGTGEIILKDEGEDMIDLLIDCPADMMNFIQEKGFIAIDGVSLTVGFVEQSAFALHLIPETLRLTSLGAKHLGDNVNIEIDSMTQTIVNTVERLMEGHL